MSAGCSDLVDQEFADFAGQIAPAATATGAADQRARGSVPASPSVATRPRAVLSGGWTWATPGVGHRRPNPRPTQVSSPHLPATAAASTAFSGFRRVRERRPRVTRDCAVGRAWPLNPVQVCREVWSANGTPHARDPPPNEVLVAARRSATPPLGHPSSAGVRGSWAETSRVSGHPAQGDRRRRPAAGRSRRGHRYGPTRRGRASYCGAAATLRVGTDQLGLHLNLSLGTWAADGLLAIFFFVVGLELKREFVAGDLRDPQPGGPAHRCRGRRHGGASADLRGLHGQSAARRCGGWAIPTATDIAFAVAGARGHLHAPSWRRCGRSCSPWPWSTTSWRSP